MQILHIIFAAVLVLGPLIAIHEFGHFWVARRLGVKVLTYSIGFGPGFIKWRDKQGTSYQIAAIPLGGFVRMVDEREGEVAPADLPYAFTRKPFWARMLIVAAGPAINLLFAVLLYWIVFLQGVDTVKMVVGKVLPDSPAAVAGIVTGDEIHAVDQKPATDWDDVNYAIIGRMGDSGSLALSVRAPGAAADRVVNIKLDHFLREGGADPYRSLGFDLYRPPIDPVIGQVLPGQAGEKQGLKVGDRVVMADGQKVTSWQQLVDIIQPHAGKPFSAQVQRGSQLVALTLTPAAQKDEAGHSVGKLGVGIDPSTAPALPPSMLRHISYGPVAAMGAALDTTGHMISFTLESFGKMLRGLISVSNLSGPITIAKVANESVELGWVPVLKFMALLSVSLGVLNLLPIPVLDGGHLVYYGVEGLIGRPLSERVQMLGLRIGLVLMGSLMLLAIFNDLSRVF
jgi:regulator of sigma E protease